jgi:hypothetical protein
MLFEQRGYGGRRQNAKRGVTGKIFVKTGRKWLGTRHSPIIGARGEPRNLRNTDAVRRWQDLRGSRRCLQETKASRSWPPTFKHN